MVSPARDPALEDLGNGAVEAFELADHGGRGLPVKDGWEAALSVFALQIERDGAPPNDRGSAR